MIQKINSIIKAQSNSTINSPDIYVIDYKNINGGSVEVLDEKPIYECVHLQNVFTTELIYVTFHDNALKVNLPQGQIEHCECVLFPSSLSEDDWVLFIETKYASDLTRAINPEYDYPNKMINQIISTVNFFRDNDILPKDKQVKAIISFPKLLDAFSEAIFTRSNLTQTQISLDYRITIKATNTGIIKSRTTIKI